MVIGGTGGFGRRLVEGLALTTDLEVIIAARRLDRARSLAAALTPDRTSAHRPRSHRRDARVAARLGGVRRGRCRGAVPGRRLSGRARRDCGRDALSRPRRWPRLCRRLPRARRRGARCRGRCPDRDELDACIVVCGPRSPHRRMASDRSHRNRDLSRQPRLAARPRGDPLDPVLCGQAGPGVRRRRLDDTPWMGHADPPRAAGPRSPLSVIV